MQTLSTISSKLIVAEYKYKQLQKESEALQKSIDEAQADLAITEKTQDFIQEAAQLTLESLSIKISKIVSKALEYVFDKSYGFDLHFEIKYSKVVCSLILMKDGEPYDLRTQQGDGIVDIVSLALRIAVLCLDKRNLRRILLLDEPAGAVSQAYQSKVGAMLEQLSTQLGIQIILVAAHGVNYNFEHAAIFNSSLF